MMATPDRDPDKDSGFDLEQGIFSHLLELRFVVQHKNIASALRSAARGVPGA